MEVLLLRHGKTAGNIARRYIGRTDEPLCAEGIHHAQQTGFDNTKATVYVSPMKRALETAEIKFPCAQYIVCADLREMDFGDFEGLTADELEHDEAYRLWVDSGCTLPCPNGESMESFTERVCRVFDTIVRNSIKQGDNRLVVVAHGGSLMAILSRYAKPSRHYYEWHTDNCGGFRSSLREEMWDAAPELTEYVRFNILGE